MISHLSDWHVVFIAVVAALVGLIAGMLYGAHVVKGAYEGAIRDAWEAAVRARAERD